MRLSLQTEENWEKRATENQRICSNHTGLVYHHVTAKPVRKTTSVRKDHPL